MTSDNGFYLSVKILNTKLAMLFDTGSSATLLKREIYDKWSTDDRPEIQPVNMSLTTATGESSPVLGKINVEMMIGNQKFRHDILLANIKSDGIVGLDLLQSQGCQIDLGKNRIMINGETVECYQKDDHYVPSCCRVEIKENVVIPPETEIILPGTLETRIKGWTGIVEPNVSFIQKSGLLVAKSLVNVNSDQIPIRVVNLSSKSCTVYKNTTAAYIEAVQYGQDEIVETVNTVYTEDLTGEVPNHLKDVYQRACDNLSLQQQKQVKDLLIKHQSVFSKDSSDIGRTNLVEHTIDTGNAKPIKQAPYRVPLAKRESAEKEIREMAEKGIIEPSVSPWCSPVVMVTKPNGSVRFCCDFRKLNDCTVKDSQPLPRIDDTLDALSGSAWFSTLDCKSGFWQVGLSHKDRNKTSFCIQGGPVWQFTVMPFGLCNAPATFERLMEFVLSGLTWKQCLVYLDDIISYSKTFEEHLNNLDEIFKRMHEANLKLSPEKCVLFQRQVGFLGHLISEKGIETDPKKIEDVVNWPLPRNVREVRSFLGLCSYYRKFVKDFSTVAKPLHKLTEKGENFIWSDDCDLAFEKLKTCLTNTPVLSYPKSDGTFILDTDASGVGIGAVLSQLQDEKEKVISYYSKCLSKVERRYCVTRRELLAVVTAIKHYHHYLYGHKFMVRSDHGALRWLTNFKNPEGQIARWLEVLATYDFDLKHRAGRIHSNADALSRRPCRKDGCDYCSRAEQRFELTKEKLGNLEEKFVVCNPTVNSLSETGVMAVDVKLSRDCVNNVNVKLEEMCDNIPNLTNVQKGLNNICKEAITDRYGVDSPYDISESSTDRNVLTQGNDRHAEILNDTQGMSSSCVSKYSEYSKDRNCRNICQLHSVNELNQTRSKLDVESIKAAQRADSVLNTLIQWKLLNTKADWKVVAPLSIMLKYYWNRYDSFILKDDVLYYLWQGEKENLNEYKIVLPKALVPDVLKELHDAPTGGHLGVRKTLFKVSIRFYWYGMSKDVKNWCKQCEVCASRKAPAKKAKAEMKQFNVGAPLERVGIDIMGPLPRTAAGNKYILAIADYFTKWVVAIPIRNQEAVTVATKFVEKFVSVFGVPLQIHSDQGTNFESQIFQEMCKLLGSEKTRTTAFRPQSDGLAERTMRTIQAMLSKFVSKNQKDWDKYLPILVLAYNASVQESTGFSPSLLMFGREITLPIDLAIGKPANYLSKTYSDFANNLEEKLEKVHELTRTHLSIASDSQKRAYDHRIHKNVFSEGSLVWLYNPSVKPGQCSKLSCKWTGPFTVIKRINDVVYRIQKNARSKPKVVHHDRLKRYEGSQ